jgi:hypothetical protein
VDDATIEDTTSFNRVVNRFFGKAPEEEMTEPLRLLADSVDGVWGVRAWADAMMGTGDGLAAREEYADYFERAVDRLVASTKFAGLTRDDVEWLVHELMDDRDAELEAEYETTPDLGDWISKHISRPVLRLV